MFNSKPLESTLDIYDNIKIEQDDDLLSTSSLPPPDVPEINLYPRKLQMKWSSTLLYPYCGLVNVDNSGYMNAVLQALFHVPAFVDWLQNEKCSKIGKNSLTYNLQQLMHYMCQKSIVEPFNVLLWLKVICPGLELGKKVDASLYLESVIQLLHEEFLQEFQNVKLDFWSLRTSPLYQIFELTKQVKSLCHKCLNFGELYETQLSVSLNIDSVSSVQESVDKWLISRPVPGTCTCKIAPVIGAKRWPLILILKLERFDEDGNKKMNPVDINFELSVAGHTYQFLSAIMDSGSNTISAYLSAAVFDGVGSINHFQDSQMSKVSIATFLYTDRYKSNSYIFLYQRVIPSITHVKQEVLVKVEPTNCSTAVSPCHLPTSSGCTALTVKRENVSSDKPAPKVLKMCKGDLTAPTVNLRYRSCNEKPVRIAKTSILQRPQLELKSRSLLRPRNPPEQCQPSNQLVFHFNDSQSDPTSNPQVECALLPFESGKCENKTNASYADKKNGTEKHTVPQECKQTCSVGVQVNLHRPCVSYEEWKLVERARFRFFTGLTQENFLVLYNFLGGDDTISALEMEYKLRKFQDMQFPEKDRLFITLVRLRRGVPVADLSKLFGISNSLLSEIFYTMIRHMSLTFQSYKDDMFASSKVKNRKKPLVFRPFKNMRVILDGFEIKIPKPFKSAGQLDLYSSERTYSTVSFLFGLSCCRKVIFVSSGYEGSITDKDMVLKSGLLEKLEKNDQVMSDHRFEVTDELLEIGVELLKPPPTTVGSLKTEEEKVWAAAIAEVKVYVQHVIGEIKKNRLLRHISQKLLPIVPDIAFVAACLVNFYDPSIRRIRAHESKGSGTLTSKIMT